MPLATHETVRRISSCLRLPQGRESVLPDPITEGGLFAKKLLEMGKTTWDYSWDNDAKSDTVQSGFARGITAFSSN
jgi:hypothetical protein